MTNRPPSIAWRLIAAVACLLCAAGMCLGVALSGDNPEGMPRVVQLDIDHTPTEEYHR